MRVDRYTRQTNLKTAVADFESPVAVNATINASNMVIANTLTSNGTVNFNGVSVFNATVNFSNSNWLIAGFGNDTGNIRGVKFLDFGSSNLTYTYLWCASGLVRYSRSEPTLSDNGTLISAADA